jgi:hypothetical protein
MKLTKIGKTEFSQSREVPGLLSCEMEYEIKSGQGRLLYTGPKFDREMWHQVLSFFRWTFKEMDSESQVRLYVNPVLGRWGAWAFPQEARTGMSAREIALQETPEKARERFASWDAEPSSDWLYFCTVHHHCSASAFQSGTDEENERNQDGLHLTIGNLGAERHDIHARFYLGGNCFEPDLSLFWPIESDLAERVPSGMLDPIARFQMCEKVTVDFPEAWRANVIEPIKESRRKKDRSADRNGSKKPERHQMDELPFWFRFEDALEEISRHCAFASIPEQDWMSALQALSENPTSVIIMDACIRHGLTPEDLLTEMVQSELQY